MEQKTVMNAKEYKRAGKAEAVAYIKRKKEAKGTEVISNALLEQLL